MHPSFKMTSIANQTATPSPAASAPPVSIASPTPAGVPASTPAPAPIGGTTLADTNASNVPANVYNDLNEQIKVRTEQLSKELEQQKRDYVLLGMSLAAQKDLAKNIASNPDLINGLDEQFKKPIQMFNDQYTERTKADAVFGAADTRIFDDASLIYGVSVSAVKRSSPSADTTVNATKRADINGAPVATHATFDNGMTVARPPAPAPALIATPATGGKEIPLLDMLDASIGGIREKNKSVGMNFNYGIGSGISVGTYSTPPNRFLLTPGSVNGKM